MKHKKEKPGLFLLSLVFMYSISSIQFFQKESDFKRLKEEGIITSAKTTFIPKDFNADHYCLEFVTQDGRKISRTAKCGDEATFIEKYKNAKVIYLTDKPDKYWDFPTFEDYSSGWSIFFFFVPYGLIGTCICYGMMRIIGYFYVMNNRKEFVKKLSHPYNPK